MLPKSKDSAGTHVAKRDLTQEERHLWYDFLRTYSVRFHRQKVIGDHIADFYCRKARLVVEIDGPQRCGAERTAAMESMGLRVLRFSDRDVRQNYVSMCEQIDRVVQERIGHIA